MAKTLYRSATDRIIAGVCGGIAAYFGLPSWLTRVIAVALIPLPGPVVIIYIAMAFLVPEEPLSNQPANRYGQR